jgi:hypothetical protein
MTRAVLCYRLGLLQTAAMGLYHFALPYHWQWQRAADSVPATLFWALFTINNYFSFVLVAASGIALWQSRQLAWSPGLRCSGCIRSHTSCCGRCRCRRFCGFCAGCCLELR